MPRPLLYIFLLAICAAFATACITRAPDPSPYPLFTSSPLPLSTTTPPPLTAHPSLQPPDPAALLRVLNYGIGLERDAWEQFDYGNFNGDFLTSPEARALFDFVQADFERYYPDGYPYAGEVLTDNSLDPNIWFPARAVWTLAQAGVVALLRPENGTLTPGASLTLADFTLTPNSIELDGDPHPEWIVEVNSTKYNLRGWLPLDEQDGQYVLIPNDLQHENQARSQGVNTQITPDLNGDGLADFLVHFDGQPLGTQFGYLKVYGKVGSGMYLLDTIQLKPGEIFEISNKKIQVRIPRSLNFECSWTQTNLYQWQGEETVYFLMDDMPPDTLLCQAALALSPLSNLLPNERASFLESTLANLTSETAPSEDYLALLYLHLEMAYAAQGLEEQMKEILYTPDFNALQGVYVEKVRSLEHGTRGRLWAFCNALFAEANRGTLEAGDLAAYFRPAAMFSAYRDTLTSYSPLLCPLQMLVEYRLGTLQLPADISPGEQQSELSGFLDQLSAYDIDRDPDKEWIGLLNFEIPSVLLFDQEGAFWKIHQLAQFDAPLSQLQSWVTDFDEAGRPDILLLATFGTSVPVSQYPACWEAGASYVSELVIISTENIEAGKKITLCGEPPILATIPHEKLREFMAEKPPQLPTLDDPREFYRFLEQQEAQIFTPYTIQSVRTTLETILFESGPGFPAADSVIPRILFDIGLTYEIERDSAPAIAAYQDLITQWPASPWAWLAEARIGE
jgi:hypothetical protein